MTHFSSLTDIPTIIILYQSAGTSHYFSLTQHEDPAHTKIKRTCSSLITLQWHVRNVVKMTPLNHQCIVNNGFHMDYVRGSNVTTVYSLKYLLIEKEINVFPGLMLTHYWQVLYMKLIAVFHSLQVYSHYSHLLSCQSFSCKGSREPSTSEFSQ